MRLPTASLTLLALLAAACAATPAERAKADADAVATRQKLAARLAGYTPGTPVDCISSFPTRSTTAYGAKIVYSGGDSTVYVNDTSGGCESMASGDYLVTVSPTGRICSGDIGRTFQPQVSIPTGSCALGRFTPYTRH